LIQAANAAKEVSGRKYLAAHNKFDESRYASSLETILREYRVSYERANTIYEYKLEELRQQVAQSQEERAKQNLTARNLHRRFVSKRMKLSQKRDLNIRFAQEMRAERLQTAHQERQAARAERLAIWQRYRATGNEQQAIEELSALTAAPKSTAPQSWWQNLRQKVATIFSRQATNEESSHVQG
jgi:hypothetical protein